MKFKDIQRDLFIRPGNSPEETVKSALLQEKRYVTASILQKQMGLSWPSSSYTNFGQSHPNSFIIKQEPTLSFQRKNNIQNRTNRAQNSRKKFINRPNNTQQRDSKPCYLCWKEFYPNHKLSCAAKNVTCKNCNKKGHFARCCNSRNNVGIVYDESEITADEDSEPEYSVLNISPSVVKTNQWQNLNIQSKTRSHQICYGENQMNTDYSES